MSSFCRQVGLLSFLDLSGLGLGDHGGHLAGNFAQLGLNFVQDGVDLGLVVDVNLQIVNSRLVKR